MSLLVKKQTTCRDFKYEDVVKELLADERGYLRDLNMVSRLFYEVAKRNNLHRGDQDLLDAVFSNMADIADVTLTFIGLLEVMGHHVAKEEEC